MNINFETCTFKIFFQRSFFLASPSWKIPFLMKAKVERTHSSVSGIQESLATLKGTREGPNVDKLQDKACALSRDLAEPQLTAMSRPELPTISHSEGRTASRRPARALCVQRCTELSRSRSPFRGHKDGPVPLLTMELTHCL